MGTSSDELASVLERVRSLPPKYRRRVWDFVDVDVPRRRAAGEPWVTALPAALAAGVDRVAGLGPGANNRTRFCLDCGVPIPPTGRRGHPRLRCPDCGGHPWAA
jgi:hypothetical protein